jgi:hypothetical protein
MRLARPSGTAAPSSPQMRDLLTVRVGTGALTRSARPRACCCRWSPSSPRSRRRRLLRTTWRRRRDTEACSVERASTSSCRPSAGPSSPEAHPGSRSRIRSPGKSRLPGTTRRPGRTVTCTDRTDQGYTLRWERTGLVAREAAAGKARSHPSTPGRSSARRPAGRCGRAKIGPPPCTSSLTRTTADSAERRRD